MRAVFVVLLNDLRRQMRDRPAVAVALLAPVVFTLIATTALGRLSHSFEDTYALVDEDGGLVDDLLVGAVLGQEGARGAISFRRFASTDAPYAAARAGDVAAVFVVERGAGAALRAGEVPGLRVVPSPSHPAGASLAAAIGQAFATQMAANRLAVETALAVPGGGATLSRDELVARARGLRLPLGLDAQAVDDAGKAGLAVYYGPSMARVVLLVVVQRGARGRVAVREHGTFARVL
ncbi:MAG: hypothetical protein KY443_07555, partial [Actinobacteria bacterium]|nr:hypothetical protein [Actinomycetota bacterium]